MARFSFLLAVTVSFLIISCPRTAERERADAGFHPDVVIPKIDLGDETEERLPEISPTLVLQAGENPIWFLLADGRPNHIETIEEARNSADIVPWPHAPHVRFMLARRNSLLMAVNGDGFIRLAGWQSRDASVSGIGLYHIPGGEFWKPYTVGAFVQIAPDENPVALLYRDEWFDSEPGSAPSPRLWAFDESSASPVSVSIPALDAFDAEEGWNLETLRPDADGFWYFQATLRENGREEIRRLRARDLSLAGEDVPIDDFQNSARLEPVSSTPPLLKEMMEAAFKDESAGSLNVVSPDFTSQRRFALNREGVSAYAFFRGAFFVAAFPDGKAIYANFDGTQTLGRFSLPALPAGFVYTGIGMVEDALFATWEERAGFGIGAAGFVVVSPPELHETNLNRR